MVDSIANSARRFAIESIQSQEADCSRWLDFEKSKARPDEGRLGFLLKESARLSSLKEHLKLGNPLAVIDIHSDPAGGLYGEIRIDGTCVGKTAVFQTADEVIQTASSQWETPFHEVHTWSQDGQIILV